MALAGHKQANRPFYRIVAAYNKRARDGKYIEQLGTYDPLPNIHNEKLVSFNYDRIKYWIGCGAHPTTPVAKLLGVYPLRSRVRTRLINIAQFHCGLFQRRVLLCLFYQGGPSVTFVWTTPFIQLEIYFVLTAL